MVYLLAMQINQVVSVPTFVQKCQQMSLFDNKTDKNIFSISVCGKKLLWISWGVCLKDVHSDMRWKPSNRKTKRNMKRTVKSRVYMIPAVESISDWESRSATGPRATSVSVWTRICLSPTGKRFRYQMQWIQCYKKRYKRKPGCTHGPRRMWSPENILMHFFLRRSQCCRCWKGKEKINKKNIVLKRLCGHWN